MYEIIFPTQKRHGNYWKVSAFSTLVLFISVFSFKSVWFSTIQTLIGVLPEIVQLYKVQTTSSCKNYCTADVFVLNFFMWWVSSEFFYGCCNFLFAKLVSLRKASSCFTKTKGYHMFDLQLKPNSKRKTDIFIPINSLKISAKNWRSLKKFKTFFFSCIDSVKHKPVFTNYIFVLAR